MYFKGEVEEEIRRLNMTDDPFDPDHLNDTLDMIDSERRKGIYHHDHTEFCLQRGIYISTSMYNILFY